jgi:hypothetical protein
MNDLPRPRTQILVAAGAIGGFAILVGAALGVTQFWGQVFVAFGAALVAATFFGWLGTPTDTYAEHLANLGISDAFDDRVAAFPDDFWASLLTNAKHCYRVLGGANHGYVGAQQTYWSATFREGFTAAVRRGVRVELLWPNLESSWAKTSEEEENRRSRLDSLEAIQCFVALRESLPKRLRSRLELKEYVTSATSCGVVWADDVLIVTHYLPATSHLRSPGLVLSERAGLRNSAMWRRWFRSTPLYRGASMVHVYSSLLDRISKGATVITNERLSELVQQRSQLSSQKPSEADLRSELRKETE